jgi:hypothetical protein
VHWIACVRKGLQEEGCTRGPIQPRGLTGRCASSLHWKQKVAPHLHCTSRGSLPTSMRASTACSHPGLGHQASCLQAG